MTGVSPHANGPVPAAFDPRAVDLRPMAETDLDLVLAWRNGERVRSRMFTTEPIAPDAHRAWWTRIARDGAHAQYVLRYAGRALGVVSFVVDAARSRAECGYYVGRDDAPPGSGTLLLYAGLEAAFGTLRLREIFCDIRDDNEPSLRLVRRFAFTERERRRPDARRFSLSVEGFVAVAPRVRTLLFAEALHALR